MKAALS